MKYNEWNMNQDSLFYELNELSPDGIISVLGVEQMNFLYSIKHGNRTLLPSIENRTTIEVSKMIHNMYMSKWTKLASIYLNEFDVGFDNSTTSEKVDIDTSNKNVNTNSTSKVSAYNDVEGDMSDVSGDIDSLTETGEHEKTSVVTITNVNIKSIDFQRELLENSNISNVICDDIASLLSLSIY